MKIAVSKIKSKNYYKESHNVFSEKIKVIVLSLAVILVCAALLISPEYSSVGVKNGLFFCSEILIPSLFPFMVISNFLIKSNLCAQIGKLMAPLTKALFNLPGPTGPTILLGLIGGYPTSARGVKALFDSNNINETQASRLMYFCVGAGPAFVLSAIGTKLLKNNKIGIILFISQILAAIMIGIFLGALSRCTEKKTDNNLYSQNIKNTRYSCAFIESCTDACQGIINLCSLVVVFSTLISILDSAGILKLFSDLLIDFKSPANIAKSILPIFLEVTTGCTTAINYKAPIELISFALGFAGTCVHFQIFSSLQGINFSIPKFIFFRFAHGTLASIITHILLIFFPVDLAVFSNTSNNLNPSISLDILGSGVIILFSLFFLLSIGSNYIDFKKEKC